MTDAVRTRSRSWTPGPCKHCQGYPRSHNDTLCPKCRKEADLEAQLAKEAQSHYVKTNPQEDSP